MLFMNRHIYLIWIFMILAGLMQTQIYRYSFVNEVEKHKNCTYNYDNMYNS